MALTLLEAAKRSSGDVLLQAVIEIFARSSDVLQAIPFESIAGNALKYNQETALPGIGFRGVNEGFAESTGIINPVTEPLVIAGGDIDVDKFILETMGSDQRASQVAMKLKSLAARWSNVFIKGDTLTVQKQFDGLQTRLVVGGPQVIENTGGAGAALSLNKLDEVIDTVDTPTHLLMSLAVQRRLTAASRNTAVGGFITFEQDAFGRKQSVYQGLPILIADRNADPEPSLAFDEAAAGGGSTSTSIYVLSLQPGMLVGIQNGAMRVTDLGEIDDKPVMRTRVEWYSGLAQMHPRSASRLRGITDLAVIV